MNPVASSSEDRIQLSVAVFTPLIWGKGHCQQRLLPPLGFSVFIHTVKAATCQQPEDITRQQPEEKNAPKQVSGFVQPLTPLPVKIAPGANCARAGRVPQFFAVRTSQSAGSYELQAQGSWTFPRSPFHRVVVLSECRKVYSHSHRTGMD